MAPPISRRGVLKGGAAMVAGAAASETTLAYPIDETDGSAVAVTIRRDEYGVPHVYARGGDGPAPTYFGFGYAVAYDRLYQLELYRRFYRGRVAEVLGEEWVDFDRESRRTHDSSVPLGEQIETQLAGEHRSILDAFADGIDRYVRDVRSGEIDREFHRGFAEGGFEPDAWDATDVAGVFVATMAFFSGSTFEPLNASVLGGLEERYDEETAMALFDDLQWGNDPDAPTSGDEPNPGYAPPYTPAGGDGGAARSARRIDASATERAGASNRHDGGAYRLPDDPDRMQAMAADRAETLAEGVVDLGLPTGIGSKGLVVHGDLTESGDALLLGGPQMGFSTPSVMYEVGLHGPDFDIAGVTVTGYPFVMFGHNGDGAFTSTAGVDNSIQTFVENVDVREGEPDRAEFRGEWEEIDEREETIPVADGEDETVTLRRTRHGIVTEYDPEAGEAIAQSRAFEGRDMLSFRAFYDAQYASSVEEYRDAAQQCDYALNFLWAGSDGDVGYFHLGRYPDGESVDWDLRLPADGTEHELTDEDYLRAADGEVPYVINPEAGYSAQWNNKPAPDWNNGDWSFVWGVDHRVQRIINLIEHRLECTGRVTAADLKEIVYDTSFVDLRAIRYADYLVEAARGAELTGTERAALEAIREWDLYRQGDAEDFTGEYPVGYAVFDEFFPRLLAKTFEPHFDPVYEPASVFLNYRYGRGTLMRALEPDATALETAIDYFEGDRDSVFLDAFRDTVAALEDERGSTVGDWTVEAEVDPLDNLTLFGVPVGVDSAGRMAWVNRGTENHVVSLGEPIEAETILPPGNSGYVSPDGERDRHYDDQLQPFESFEYKPLSFSDGAVARRTESKRTIPTGEGRGSNADGGRESGDDRCN